MSDKKQPKFGNHTPVKFGDDVDGQSPPPKSKGKNSGKGKGKGKNSGKNSSSAKLFELPMSFLISSFNVRQSLLNALFNIR